MEICQSSAALGQQFWCPIAPASVIVRAFEKFAGCFELWISRWTQRFCPCVLNTMPSNENWSFYSLSKEVAWDTSTYPVLGTYSLPTITISIAACLNHALWKVGIRGWWRKKCWLSLNSQQIASFPHFFKISRLNTSVTLKWQTWGRWVCHIHRAGGPATELMHTLLSWSSLTTTKKSIKGDPFTFSYLFLLNSSELSNFSLLQDSVSTWQSSVKDHTDLLAWGNRSCQLYLSCQFRV